MKGVRRFLFLINFLPLFVFAQTALQTQLKNEKKKLALSLSATTASNLQSPQSNFHSAMSSFLMSATYSLGSQYKLGVISGVLQEHSGLERTMMSHTTLRGSRSPIVFNQNLSLLPTFNLVLPTNIEDREDTTYQGSLSANTQLIQNIHVLGNNLEVLYGLKLTKNSHQLTLSKYGSSNISYSSSQNLGISTQFIREITLGVEGSWTQTWTYRDTRKDIFSIDQYLSYAASEQLFLTLGHSNEALLLEPNGRGNNLSIYSERTSQVYANLRAIF